ncbi:MAG: hypothetical protein AB7P03_15565 [Kofleriaceae bacterium]
MKPSYALLPIAVWCSAVACGSSHDGGDDDPGPGPGSDPDPRDEWDILLDGRDYDYNAALRIAALRLTGDIPSLAEINQIASAGDLVAKKAAYEALVADYLERPTFAAQMLYFWRDTFKLGESPQLDGAPTFAAQLAVENRSYLELFTATANTCPTLDEATGTFAAASCPGPGPTAGVLTNRGAMALYFSNFAFRRVRWVQETFDCTKFPAEVSEASQDVGGAAPYNGVWPFTSISGNGIGRVNFLDTSAVICANCHQTINHIAPLFAHYDRDGVYQPQIAVPTPLEGAPLAELGDYLPAGETTAWRYGAPAADLPALGAAIAADPDVARCGVARIWNWALGKTDIVDTLMEVPSETIDSQLAAFTANGHKLKDLIFAIYTSDDFVKF